MRIHLTVIFNTHGTADDAKRLVPYIKDCDLFIPEITNWHHIFRNAIYRLSRNELSLQDFKEKYIRPDGWSEDTYYGVLYKAIYEYQPEIYIVEPSRNAGLMTVKTNLDTRRHLRELLEDSDASKAMKELRIFFSKECSSNRKREAYLTHNFKSRITKRIGRSKKLLPKESVNVLMVIGVGHEAIFENLAFQIKGTVEKIVIDGQNHLDCHGNLQKLSALRRKGIAEHYSPSDEELLLFLFPGGSIPSPSLS